MAVKEMGSGGVHKLTYVYMRTETTDWSRQSQDHQVGLTRKRKDGLGERKEGAKEHSTASGKGVL